MTEHINNTINKINDMNISDDQININYYSNSILNLDKIINTNINTNINKNLNTIINENINILSNTPPSNTPPSNTLPYSPLPTLTHMNDDINLEILLNCVLESIIEISKTNTYYRDFIENNIFLILNNSTNKDVQNFINNNEEILIKANTFKQIKLIHQINLDLVKRKKFRNLKEINRLIFMYSDETCDNFMLLLQKGFTEHQHWTYDTYDTIHLILMHNLVQPAIILKDLGFENINHIYSIVKSNKLEIAIDLWNRGFRKNDLIAYMSVDVSVRSRTYAINHKKRGLTEDEIQSQFIYGHLKSNL
jgi:hypothetical protein